MYSVSPVGNSDTLKRGVVLGALVILKTMVLVSDVISPRNRTFVCGIDEIVNRAFVFHSFLSEYLVISTEVCLCSLPVLYIARR